MPKRDKLKLALENLNIDTVGHLTALDDLIKAGSDAKKMRKALIEHQKYWMRLGLPADAFKNDDSFLNSKALATTTPTLDELQQLAVKKRVEISIDRASSFELQAYARMTEDKFKENLIEDAKKIGIEAGIKRFFEDKTNIRNAQEQIIENLFKHKIRGLTKEELTPSEVDKLLEPYSISLELKDKLCSYANIEFLIANAYSSDNHFIRTKKTNFEKNLIEASNLSYNKLAILGSEKAKLELRFIEAFLENYPNFIDTINGQKLTDFQDIIFSNDFDLRSLGLALSPKTEDIAALRLKALSNVIKTSVFALSARLQLLHLLISLPEGTRTDLLSSAPKFEKLVAIENFDELVSLLGENSKYAVGLLQENKRLNLISKISNNEIALMLANITPPIQVNVELVNKINNNLYIDEKELIKTINPNVSYSNFSQGEQAEFRQKRQKIFRNKIDEIVSLIKPQITSLTQLNTLKIDMEKAVNLACRNNDFNMNNKAINKILMNAIKLMPEKDELRKNIAFDEEDLQQIESVLVSSTNYNDIALLINNKAWCTYLSPQFFADFKAAQTKEELLTERYSNILSTQRDQTKDFHLELQKIKETLFIGERPVVNSFPTFVKAIPSMASMQAQKIKDGGWAGKKELQWLANFDIHDWFDPALQNQDVADSFGDLAKECEGILTVLREQQQTLEHHLKALPTVQECKNLDDARQKEQIQTRRKEVENLLATVNEGIALYLPAYRVLQGDPDAVSDFRKKGLVQSLNEIQQRRISPALQTTAKHTYIDELVDATNSINTATVEKSFSDNTAVHTSGSRRFKIVPLETGFKRKHIVDYGDGKPNALTLKGTFYEERDEQSGQSKDKYTVDQFPKNKEAQAPYAMIMASQLLAGLQQPPSKNHRLIIQGSNPNEVAFLWTALRALGVKKEAIDLQVSKTVFDPSYEEGFLSFKKTSIYKQFFDSNEKVREIIDIMEDFEKDKKSAAKNNQELGNKAESWGVEELKRKLGAIKALKNNPQPLNTVSTSITSPEILVQDNSRRNSSGTEAESTEQMVETTPISVNVNNNNSGYKS